MGLFVRTAIALAAAASVSGCDANPSLELREWTLQQGDRAPSSLTLPAHFDDALPQAHARYVLTREVDLPPAFRAGPLVLTLPRLLAHAKLRVNDREVPAFVGDEDPSGYRARGPHAWRIPSEVIGTAPLRVAIEVDHTWTQSGWIDAAPQLTTAPDGGAAFVVRNAWNTFTDALALTAVLFSAYLYLYVFLADRRRTTYVIFAITCLSGAAYPLFHSALAQALFGPWEVTVTGIGVLTSTFSQLHFTSAYFGEPRPQRAWLGAWALGVAVTLARTGYFASGSTTGRIAALFAIPAIIAQVVLLVRLARRRPRPANTFIVLAPWAVHGVLAIPDFAAWCGMGTLFGPLRGGDLGIALIGLLQTAALGSDHVVSLRNADALALEREARIRDLEAGKRAVESLNAELRHQIAARSAEFASAIARLANASPFVDIEPGMIVGGRYEIVRKLGAGAGGIVYLVERVADRSAFAMKVVMPSQRPLLIARLAREAQLAATVNHENVVAVVDVDVDASGVLFIVMEYVAGDSLRAYRSSFGDVAWALSVLEGLAAGLAAVHRSGVVHRDLKPSNVLLVPHPARGALVKIADFGISGMSAEASTEDLLATVVNASEARPPLPTPDLTETGMLLGTPLYMAPESVDGAKNAAPAVDVFSFGVIAFELITGSLPFRSAPALARLDGRTADAPYPMLELRPEAPPEIAAVVERCLALAPEDRPSAAELERSFRRQRAA